MSKEAVKMGSWNIVCRDCVLNNDCLFQSNDDVEECEDVQIKQPLPPESKEKEEK